MSVEEPSNKKQIPTLENNVQYEEYFCLYNYEKQDDTELDLKENDVVIVHEKDVNSGIFISFFGN